MPAASWLMNLGFAGGTAASEIVVPGLEFTLQVDRFHFTLDENRQHYTLPQNRMHFTQEEED